MKFAEIVLLQVRMKFNLIHDRFVFCNFEDSLNIFDPEIGYSNVLSEAYYQLECGDA